MLLGGLWHGAGWTFVVWGALHGAGLVVERWVRERRGSGTAPSAMGRGIRTVATIHLVCVGWVFFRAVDLERAGEVLAALAGSWTSAPSLDWGVVVILVVGATAQFLPRGLTDPWWSWLGRSPVAVQAVVVIVAIVGMDVLGPDGVAPFIYFQF